MTDMIALATQMIDLILHVDAHLREWTMLYGPWIYLILFIIIFCETGLVVTPFLPGDSLLFAAGAMTALGAEGLDIWFLSLLLIVAAILGDQTNYFIGRKFGTWLLSRPNQKLVKEEHFRQTEKFMLKYGASAIVLARFAPIVRTFAPFVVGVGRMPRQHFIKYNILGAILWVEIFLWLGHFFGNLPVVQKNFSLVIVVIVILSLIPMVVGVWKARKDALKDSRLET